ncbi:transcription termination/antitermination protein NusG [soil metagenome]
MTNEDKKTEEMNSDVNESNVDEKLPSSADAIAESNEDDADSPFKWYAVRIVSGHENKVKSYLDNEIRLEGLEELIKHVLIPLEKVFEVKNGKKKVKFKNFLPGYILINTVLNENIKEFINKTPSIISMVGVKDKKNKKLDPTPLSPVDVRRIKGLLNEDAQNEKLDIQLNAGDPVKVVSGPFNNFNGNVLEVFPDRMKVKVMVSIFGRKTPIELELTQIEKE